MQRSKLEATIGHTAQLIARGKVTVARCTTRGASSLGATKRATRQQELHNARGYNMRVALSSQRYARSEETLSWLYKVCDAARGRHGETSGKDVTMFSTGNTLAPAGATRKDIGASMRVRVRPRYEEPLDDDVAAEDKMARVDSDIESSDKDEEDSEMGKAALAPIDDEE
ncbi:hypothetical protein HAX54_029916 [Datura stramonium]|uniref:Uncharacterized protein n=1 Tax=Datura stramonium TaxID=4076 RepID=A0ABS8V823_DATST|nr:hypothetical protein [Datura stramonium]